MAGNRYIKSNPGMDQDIELGDVNTPRSFGGASNKITDEFLTPLANGNCSFATGDISNEEQEASTGKRPPKLSAAKSNSGERVKKLIRQSSEVGLFFLENSGDQVPRKVQGLIKRSSSRIERFFEGSNIMNRREDTQCDDIDRRNSLEYAETNQKQSRLETIRSSPTLIPPDQPTVEITEVDQIGLDSLTALPLIPTSLSFLSTPSFTIPFHDSPAISSSASISGHDTISMSTTMGYTQDLPEGLKEAIALNYPEEVRRQLDHYSELFGFSDITINFAFWYACAHGAEKSANVLMGQYRADPASIHKNVPCIQLAARRGNVALLDLILSKHPQLVSDAMPKDAKVEFKVPDEEGYTLHRQSDASIGENYQIPRRNSNIGLSIKKGKERLRNYKRMSKRPTLDEEEHNTTIHIEYTHLSTPLHQTTLMNDVPMTKILVETYKADIEARDCHLKTALTYAAEEGGVQTLKYLLESDAGIDRRDVNGYTALMHAVKMGNRQCILLLLQKGANINFKDYMGKSLFEIAKDETVCVYVAKLLLNDSVTLKIPLHGLVKKGYTHCFQLIVDNTIHYKGDCWVFDLRTFQMDDNGVLPVNENDYKEKKLSLLEEISNCDNMDFVDCLPLRILVSHWLMKYGIWYIFLKSMLFILNMTALSYLFIATADELEPRKQFNFRNTSNSIKVLSLVFISFSWLLHVFFEGCEIALRCKTKWNALRTKQKETEGKISFQMDTLYFFESLPFGIADYLRCLHNIIDLGIISSLPLYLVFFSIDSPLQWYFASILYFLRALEIVKLLTVSPFGIYVHTIWTTLSGDLPKFLVIVALSLFTFSGTLFISFRAPANDYLNQTLPVSDRKLLRDSHVTEYWWLLLTSIRYLIEQGSVVKVDYITIFNWFAVIVFFVMLGWILLILRVIFIAHVSNTYALSRNRAERYVTSYKLDFLLKMQQSSLISLVLDLKKKYYSPMLEISRKKMRKYFESDITYALWNSTWVDRVEEAINTRRRRNLQYKDKQLFSIGLGVADQLDPNSGVNNWDGPSLEASNRRTSTTPHPSMEVMHLLDQHHNNLRTEFSQIIDEKLQMMEQKQLIKQQEINQKMEQMMTMVMCLTREVRALNHHIKAEDFPTLSDSD